MLMAYDAWSKWVESLLVVADVSHSRFQPLLVQG
jgi:hypothetical protein